MIERRRGRDEGRNKSSAYGDLVWTVATSPDTTLSIEGQTQQALDTTENNLKELKSDKSRIVSAQVFISNMDDKSKMDAVWKAWIGEDPKHWPQRVCLGVALEGDVLIEVTVTAVRG